jgi:hypothetical protein
MPRRLLNIASVVCLVACVALMGMWVRSYDQRPGLLATTQRFNIGSLQGRLMLIPSENNEWWWMAVGNPSVYPGDPAYLSLPKGTSNPAGFRLYLSGSASALIVPYWFLVLTSGSLAMIFQLRWPPRFTLRSLFLATTLLAVVLGMIAWLDQAWIGK